VFVALWYTMNVCELRYFDRKNPFGGSLLSCYTVTMPAMTQKPKRYKKQVELSLTRQCARYVRTTYPHVLFFCDASGVNMSDTMRIAMSEMRAKDLRVLDFVIDYPSRGYHGARFEIKPEGTVIYNKDGSLRKQPYIRRFKNGSIKRGDHLAEQAASIMRYNEAGYFSRFTVGFQVFKQMVDWYMENENASLF